MATRDEKRAVNYRAMVVIASLAIWLDSDSSNTLLSLLQDAHGEGLTAAGICLTEQRFANTSAVQ